MMRFTLRWNHYIIDCYSMIKNGSTAISRDSLLLVQYDWDQSRFIGISLGSPGLGQINWYQSRFIGISLV